MAPPKKKFILPVKASIKSTSRKTKATEVAAQEPSATTYEPIHTLKAVEYTIKLEDGTYLQATGKLAEVIYDYVRECEKQATLQNLATYMGPSLARYSADGTLIGQRKS